MRPARRRNAEGVPINHGMNKLGKEAKRRVALKKRSAQKLLRVRCIVCSLGRDGENWCLALITRTPAEGSSRHSKKLYRRIEREYGYAYAAVAPHDGALVSLVLPEVNAGLMSLFLAEVGRRYPHEFVLMVLDGAGWHKAGDLVVPVQMRLEWLPARSPELNPRNTSGRNCARVARQPAI